ncbi:MAG: hypothetical protein U0744_21655 [Gemmataceae bacterium]
MPNVATLLFVLFCGLNYFSPLADLDWSWQVRTGEQIVRTGSLRVADEFTYTIADKPLHDFEWLYEVLLYGTWSAFGMGGLKLLRVLFVAAPLWILAKRLQRERFSWHAIGLTLLLSFIVLAQAWNLRPMLVTTIGLLLVSGWLHEHCNGGKLLDWKLPAVMLLWANGHPGVIAGQGMLAAAIGWECFNRFVKWNTPLERDRLLRLIAYAGLGLAASLVCPDPLERIRYTFKPELAHPIHREFVEMLPLWVAFRAQPMIVLPVYLVAFAVLTTIVLRPRAWRVWELVVLAALGALGNFATRSMPDWYLVMLSLGLPHVRALWLSAVATDARRSWVRRLLSLDNTAKRLFASRILRWQPRWAFGILGVLAIASALPNLGRTMPIAEGADWPTGAMDFAAQQQLAGNYFAPPDYGAYVGWRLKDTGKAYVDTRGFFFPPTLLEDSIYLPRMNADWQERLDRVLAHGTDYFLVETTGGRGRLWEMLKPHLDQPLYVDEKSALLRAADVKQAAEKLVRASR